MSKGKITDKQREILDYIREVKQMNRMISDNIEAGDSLTIVYFAQAPLQIN